MDYGIFDVLKLIGSLGVFLYGMKLMSESLQKLAGNKMRQILTAMTSNRVTGCLLYTSYLAFGVYSMYYNYSDRVIPHRPNSQHLREVYPEDGDSDY